MLCKLLCNLYKCANYVHSLRKVKIREREPRPGAQTHGLRASAEFQSCEPPIRPQSFVPNSRRYGHGRATMLRPLRTRALRLNLCDGTLSAQKNTPVCITLTDNAQRDRNSAASSNSCSRAHASANCQLSIPSNRSSLKARVISGHSIVVHQRPYLWQLETKNLGIVYNIRTSRLSMSHLLTGVLD